MKKTSKQVQAEEKKEDVAAVQVREVYVECEYFTGEGAHRLRFEKDAKKGWKLRGHSQTQISADVLKAAHNMVAKLNKVKA